MYDIPFFFGAAAVGFVLMAALGVQAAVALFSSVPLTRRHKAENPAFDAKRAFRRVTQVSILSILICAVVTALVMHFASTGIIAGYALGFVLAFVMSLKRMSPNNAQNRENYEEAYADCYPASEKSSEDAAKPSSVANEEK